MTKTYLAILVTVLLTFFSSSAFAQISFAILPMESKGDVSKGDKEAAESALYQNLIQSGKYQIVERRRIGQILEEQKLRLTGITDPSKVVEIGKIIGIEKLITSTIYTKSRNQLAINITVIDVATAQVEFSKEQSLYNYTAGEHGRFCAADIIVEYPLLGKILGKAKDTIVVNLGKNHGLKIGDRLFVARKEVLLDKDDKILFQEFNRLGTLEVTKLDAAQSQTKVKSLEDPNNSFKKDDLVSPEPIPKKEPLISYTPLLPNIEKGKLLLEDNMKKNKYLSPSHNKGEDYIGGKLHLNATHLKSGHAHCLYPVPFDRMENFIIEGEVEFQKVEKHYNKFSVVFRLQTEYGHASNYSFYWHDEGKFKIGKFITGSSFTIVPLQSSPAIHRGASKNRFRIVAYGSRFDCYLNGEFIVGFEDELLEKGGIGFKANHGGYSTVDNVKIWEAVKK